MDPSERSPLPPAAAQEGKGVSPGLNRCSYSFSIKRGRVTTRDDDAPFSNRRRTSTPIGLGSRVGESPSHFARLHLGGQDACSYSRMPRAHPLFSRPALSRALASPGSGGISPVGLRAAAVGPSDAMVPLSRGGGTRLIMHGGRGVSPFAAFANALTPLPAEQAVGGNLARLLHKSHYSNYQPPSGPMARMGSPSIEAPPSILPPAAAAVAAAPAAAAAVAALGFAGAKSPVRSGASSSLRSAPLVGENLGENHTGGARLSIGSATGPTDRPTDEDAMTAAAAPVPATLGGPSSDDSSWYIVGAGATSATSQPPSASRASCESAARKGEAMHNTARKGNSGARRGLKLLAGSHLPPGSSSAGGSSSSHAAATPLPPLDDTPSSIERFLHASVADNIGGDRALCGALGLDITMEQIIAGIDESEEQQLGSGLGSGLAGTCDTCEDEGGTGEDGASVQQYDESGMPIAPQAIKSSKSRGGRPKKCNCRNSKCLKLYCDCFSVGLMCDGCNCQDCANKEETRDKVDEARKSVLKRNPKAFQAKFIDQEKGEAAKEGVTQKEKTKHARGCNCTKSRCIKNYCECWQMGIECTDKCKCVDCANNGNVDKSGGAFLAPSTAATTTTTQGLESTSDLPRMPPMKLLDADELGAPGSAGPRLFDDDLFGGIGGGSRHLDELPFSSPFSPDASMLTTPAPAGYMAHGAPTAHLPPATALVHNRGGSSTGSASSGAYPTSTPLAESFQDDDLASLVGMAVGLRNAQQQQQQHTSRPTAPPPQTVPPGFMRAPPRLSHGSTGGPSSLTVATAPTFLAPTPSAQPGATGEALAGLSSEERIAVLSELAPFRLDTPTGCSIKALLEAKPGFDDEGAPPAKRIQTVLPRAKEGEHPLDATTMATEV